jgi:hypothetical protein
MTFAPDGGRNIKLAETIGEIGELHATMPFCFHNQSSREQAAGQSGKQGDPRVRVISCRVCDYNCPRPAFEVDDDNRAQLEMLVADQSNSAFGCSVE